MVDGMFLPDAQGFQSKWSEIETGKENSAVSNPEKWGHQAENLLFCPGSLLFCPEKRSSQLACVKKKSPANPLVYWTFWRRVRDSNPRDLSVYSISSAAPSTTRTTLLVCFSLKFHQKLRAELQDRTTKYSLFWTGTNPHKHWDLRWTKLTVYPTISSQARYDHFITSSSISGNALISKRLTYYVTVFNFIKKNLYCQPVGIQYANAIISRL